MASTPPRTDTVVAACRSRRSSAAIVDEALPGRDLLAVLDELMRLRVPMLLYVENPIGACRPGVATAGPQSHADFAHAVTAGAGRPAV